MIVTRLTTTANKHTPLNITCIMRHNILIRNALLARVIVIPYNDTPTMFNRRQNRFTAF